MTEGAGQMNYEALLADIEEVLGKYAPGGMVGSFVIAAEMYDTDGQPQLHTMRDSNGTAWTHLGLIEALHIDTATPFRQRYNEDQ